MQVVRKLVNKIIYRFKGKKYTTYQCGYSMCYALTTVQYYYHLIKTFPDSQFSSVASPHSNSLHQIDLALYLNDLHYDFMNEVRINTTMFSYIIYRLVSVHSTMQSFA